MLALFALAGGFSLLLVCITCRQPGVRLFTVITLPNRKRTLTRVGVAIITLSLLYPSAFMQHRG